MARGRWWGRNPIKLNFSNICNKRFPLKPNNMNEDSYRFEKSPLTYYYEFYSHGPKGKIKKVVQYQQVSMDEEVFNLGFGDVEFETGEVNDLSISNNQDTRKVLATIAQTVVAFVEDHPKAVIMAKGSTPSRTRLYQMGIAQFWDEIGKMFEVKGLIDNEWQSFEKGKNFEAFFIFKK